MDLRAAMDGSGGRWTEERHSRFLNRMESTFVHQMLNLHSDGRNFHRSASRFDRRVPDRVTGFKSTENSPIRLPPTLAADPDPGHAASVARENGSYTRKQSLGRYDTSLDQVVPQFENKSDDQHTHKGK
ncbi:hypothetical protein IEQ34_014414 [Dendrobium chrysotoxum]|uniref:Uncharacterized protein n=1 Tax=Dendrobium chrysotoxum TaxID=161865 RepID=A0AAV7GJT8_DENCH|nr:hypothetical protein IEQ34_014414 [Dendrobium chrysotoxum]